MISVVCRRSLFECSGAICAPWSAVARIFLGAAIMLSMAAGAHADVRKGLTANQLAKLSAGKVLVYATVGPKSSAGIVRAVIDIPVSAKVLWRVMLDCRRARKYLAGLQGCRVIDRAKNGTWDIRELRVRWVWYLPEIRSLIRSEYVDYRAIRFERAGGDLNDFKGSWSLHPIANGSSTRLFYQAKIDTGFVFSGTLVRSAMLSDVPMTLKALRREAVRLQISQ